MVYNREIVAGTARGEGQEWVHQSYPDNGSSIECWLLPRKRKPQGSPFSRWGCVSRAEAIRPAIILHLLSSIAVPSARGKAAPQTQKRKGLYHSKKTPDKAQWNYKLCQLFFLLIALDHFFVPFFHLHLLLFRFAPSTLFFSTPTRFFAFQKN